MGGRREPELSAGSQPSLLVHQVQAEGPAVPLAPGQGRPPGDRVGEARDSLQTLVG